MAVGLVGLPMPTTVVAIPFLIFLITLDEQRGIVFAGVQIEESGLGAKEGLNQFVPP